MMHGTDWFMGGMWIFWLVILVGLFFLARWMVTTTGGTREQTKPKESAEEILKRRYASGEVDRQEYEQKLRDLEHRA